jgi:hypothetical protein
MRHSSVVEFQNISGGGDTNRRGKNEPISKVTTVLGCATNGITDIIRLGLYFRGVSRNLFRRIKCFDEMI